MTTTPEPTNEHRMRDSQRLDEIRQIALEFRGDTNGVAWDIFDDLMRLVDRAYADLSAAEARGAAKEREACAKLVLEVPVEWSNFHVHPDPNFPGEFEPHNDNGCLLCIAAAIRQRPVTGEEI